MVTSYLKILSLHLCHANCLILVHIPLMLKKDMSCSVFNFILSTLSSLLIFSLPLLMYALSLNYIGMLKYQMIMVNLPINVYNYFNVFSYILRLGYYKINIQKYIMFMEAFFDLSLI